MGERSAPTAADYVIVVLSPLLIMLMVGSFVFFLVEVLYQGEYTERLLYTLFFFVVAAVLTARIAIELGSARAGIYALVLGLVTFAALQAYVHYPSGSSLAEVRGLVHAGLLLLIGWCTHQLTWDCTCIDERRRGAGRGILAAAGLIWEGSGKTTTMAPVNDNNAAARADAQPTPQQIPAPQETLPRRRKRRRQQGDSRLWAWIEAYQRHREQQQRRPHTPGVWVLYCSLAALPVFALGQSLIDPHDDVRRRATLLQMVAFTTSALGLLATTSLLGLRRYLRQRKIRIPATLTVGWLSLAVVLIALFIVLGVFLPRPHAETPWFGLSRLGSDSRHASHYAVLRNSPGKGQGRPGETVRDESGKNASTDRKKDASLSGGAQHNTNDKNEKPGRKSAGSDPNLTNQEGHPKIDGKQGTDNGDGKKKREQVEQQGLPPNEGAGTPASDVSRSSGNGENAGSPSSPPKMMESPRWLSRLSMVIKWLAFAVVALLVVIVLLLAVLRGLAPFTHWARQLLEALQLWWERLWGARTNRVNSIVQAGQDMLQRRLPPWTSFTNPYVDGSAAQRSLSELIDYTLLAWEAWAYEQSCPRVESETAQEFLTRIGQWLPDAADTLYRFAWLHARATYGAVPLSAREAHAVLRQVWGVLERAPEPGVAEPMLVTVHDDHMR